MPQSDAAARAKAAPTLPSGTQIGQYEVLDRIAVGGMAELYLARRVGIEGFEKRVALKRVLPQLIHDAEFTSMFLDEARLAARLDHPNVVQVIDIGVLDDEFFFVMEYLHGKNLRKVLREACPNNVAPLDFALNVVIRMAAGLHHAHQARDAQGQALELVHRDVSPQNVIVTYDGHVKLVDFGIAKAAAKRASTQTGTLKGKIGYMSPEQCRGMPVDRRADLFALGVVLYELTVGKRPFVGENQFAIIGAANEGRYERPCDVVPDYPPQLQAIIEKLLVADRDQRYSDAETVQTELEDFAAQLGIRVSSSVLRNFMRSKFDAPDIISGPIRTDGTDPGRSLSSYSAPSAIPDEIRTAASIQIPLQRSRLYLILGVAAVALLIGGVSLGVWLSSSGATAVTPATKTPPPAAATVEVVAPPVEEDAEDEEEEKEPSPPPADPSNELDMETVRINPDAESSSKAKNKRKSKGKRKPKKDKPAPNDGGSSLFPPSYK